MDSSLAKPVSSQTGCLHHPPPRVVRSSPTSPTCPQIVGVPPATDHHATDSTGASISRDASIAKSVVFFDYIFDLLHIWTFLARLLVSIFIWFCVGNRTCIFSKFKVHLIVCKSEVLDPCFIIYVDNSRLAAFPHPLSSLVPPRRHVSAHFQYFCPHLPVSSRRPPQGRRSWVTSTAGGNSRPRRRAPRCVRRPVLCGGGGGRVNEIHMRGRESGNLWQRSLGGGKSENWTIVGAFCENFY